MPHSNVSPSTARWLRGSTATALRLVGPGLVLLALGMMWAARIVFPGDTYVSGLGAAGEITATAFNLSLGLVALGGASSAFGLWGLRSGRGLFGAWAVSTSLVGASAMFAVGAAVPCTTGCPIPFSAAAPQDAVHTVAAVTGFALAGVAIIQTLRLGRAYATLAAPSILLVIATSATGGVLSLAGVATDLGGWLELVATTAALLWLAALTWLTQHRIATGRPTDRARSEPTAHTPNRLSTWRTASTSARPRATPASPPSRSAPSTP